MSLKESLGQSLLFFDGAMGTVLQSMGYLDSLPEYLNITNEDVISGIHSAYIKSGVNIIKTNTFGANRLKMTRYSVDDVITKAVTIAKKAADDKAYVALDIGPTGRLLKPFGDLDFEDAYDIFSEMITVGNSAGADLVLIETMTDIYEAKAAILAAKENCDLPVIVTFSFDDDGKLLTGGDSNVAISVAEGLGVDAVGLNCGVSFDVIKKLLFEFIKSSSIPIAVSPNAGLPFVINGKTVYDISPADFAQNMSTIVDIGASIIGGCCGTTSLHIAEMIDVCKDLPVKKTVTKNTSIVSSYSKSVIIGKNPVLIGERINPTGKPLLKQALLENDMNYIIKEALRQAENGADVLDINVGLAGIDEPRVMQNVIKELQSVVNTPLQIDTSNVRALELALRVYNGKPIMNSVNGKQSSLHTVLPLVKKYGAAVVALLLDEDGIPDTAEGRIAIAEKIIDTAKSYGIEKKDILIDALTLTISTGQQNAKITLDTVAELKNRLNVNTVLGVSNVSFGLPERETVNKTFLILALEKGLSAAIIDPLCKPVTDAYYSYQLLCGDNFSCSEYIEKFSVQNKISSAVYSETDTLFKAIVRGQKEQSKDTVCTLLQDTEPLVIIDKHIIPALNEVGIEFEAKRLFLPNLLMSAEAAGKAFEELKKHLLSQGITQDKKGKIILATVEGDIHDIGKNIVKVLLQNYNFDVIDLGKDVDTDTIVDTVTAQSVCLVGLSALMTTTVSNMEKTICALHKNAPQCKIMVGGAVLTQSYADEIKADFYSKDALGAVDFANQIFA